MQSSPSLLLRRSGIKVSLSNQVLSSTFFLVVMVVPLWRPEDRLAGWVVVPGVFHRCQPSLGPPRKLAHRLQGCVGPRPPPISAAFTRTGVLGGDTLPSGWLLRAKAGGGLDSKHTRFLLESALSSTRPSDGPESSCLGDPREDSGLWSLVPR